MLRKAFVAVIACTAFADAAGSPQQAGPGPLIVNGSLKTHRDTCRWPHGSRRRSKAIVI